MKNAARKAVVLLSGGLDSATCLAEAAAAGFNPLALSFRYGQRHAQELDAAQALATVAGVARHAIIDIDLRAFGGSALTADINVPKGRAAETIGEGIPITYVPARNTIFLSFALAFAEVEGASDIFIGVNALDYSGYPDCRPDYIRAYAAMANLATRAAVADGDGTPLTIHTPLLELSKADIVRRAVALGVDVAATLSCYDPLPGLVHCGACDACLLRKKGFQEAGTEDPTRYAP